MSAMEKKEFDYHWRKRDFPLKLRQAYTLTEQKLNNLLQGTGITTAQLTVLQYLFTHQEEPTYQADLSNFLMVRHTTVIETVKRLQTKGYVRITREGTRKKISLTEEGRQLVNSVEQKTYESYLSLYGSFDPQTLYQLDVLLDQYISAVSEI